MHSKVTQEVVLPPNTDIHSTTAPRINLRAEQVDLKITADGKTITFNNREALEQYREAIKIKNSETLNVPKINNKEQVDNNLGSQIHSNRDWE